MIVKSVPENVLKNKNYQNVQSSVKACMQFIITPIPKQRSIMPTKNYTLLY